MKVRWKVLVGLLLLASTISQSAWATPTAVNGKIVTLTGGWTNPDLLIVLDSTFVNPAGCSLTDGYVVSASLPANQQLTAMAISAYSMKERVTLIIDGCSENRPSVIGLTFGGQ